MPRRLQRGGKPENAIEPVTIEFGELDDIPET